MAIKERSKTVYVSDDGVEHEEPEGAQMSNLKAKVTKIVDQDNGDRRDPDEVRFTANCVVEFIIENYGDLLNAFQEYESEHPASG